MCCWKFENGNKQNRALRVEMASSASNIVHCGTQSFKLLIQRPGFCLAELTSPIQSTNFVFPTKVDLSN